MVERRRGRDATVLALVQAARELFAERGPAAVSLRVIARRAGVNHGLIHHYIGSRDDLLRLVFATSTDAAAEEITGAAGVLDALARLRRRGEGNDDYARLLAWALLEGHDPAAFHGRSSALDAVVAAAGDDSREVRIAIAVDMVHTLGWKLFGAYATSAAGLDGEDPDVVRSAAAALVDDLVVRATGDVVAP